MYVTRIFVIPKRFERLTHALEGRCSIQLSYGTYLCCNLERLLFCVCKDSAFIPFAKIFSAFFLRYAILMPKL